MANDWKYYNLTENDRAHCMRHGKLMREGKVGLGNVKHGDIDSEENYSDGKMSEHIFSLWLKQNGVPVIHAPFREDYKVLNPHDDFIIGLAGKCVQVEVRHKTRNAVPRDEYQHCSDSVKSDRIYVFTERTREAGAKTRPKTSVGYFSGRSILLGWIDPTRFRRDANFEPVGTVKTDNQGNPNFILHREEWNIQIADLYEMSELIDGSRSSVIPYIQCP